MCDGLGVTMTTYLSLGVVEYLLCVWWIGGYHDYIPEDSLYPTFFMEMIKS